MTQSSIDLDLTSFVSHDYNVLSRGDKIFLSAKVNVIIIVLISLAGIWLVVLSVLFYLLYSHYTKLIGETKGADLKKVLDEILKVQEQNTKDLKYLDEEKRKIEAAATFCIQKVGLVKYNPFNETGGDHSFSLALLDGQNSGILVTGLHTREKTRIYVKSIKKGEAARNLSNEEKKALASAGRVENLEQ